MRYKFRSPARCQNGHFRWLYWVVRFGKVTKQEWGVSPCNCPTHDFNEAFAPCGPDQLFTGLRDRNKQDIYEGDIIQRYPPHKYSPFAVLYDRDEGFGLSESAQVDYEVIGNIYQKPDRKDFNIK